MTDSASRPLPGQHAPATLRNRAPIASVLREVLPGTGKVLEIASGSGEHVAYFASLFPNLHWQPSDISDNSLAVIRQRIRDSDGSIAPPIRLNTTDFVWPVSDFDVIFCANMIHISPWESTLGLMNGAGNVLNNGGILYLYGPFIRDGVETAPSNIAFDESLRRQNPQWGIRDMTEVADHANMSGLSLERVVEMPANNLSVIFRKV